MEMTKETEVDVKNVAYRTKKDGFKPRVLILSDLMRSGGMERQIIELLKGLRQNGRYSVVLGVLDQGGSREAEAKELVDIYLSMPRRTRFDISPAFSISRQVKALNVSLIHTFGWMSGVAGLAAAKLNRVPIINGGIRVAPVQLSLQEKISRWCAQHSDMIVSNSQAGLRSYRLAGHPRAKVIYNGVDFNRFAFAMPDGRDEKYLCMVANFGPFKDHPSMIEAFSMIKDRFPDIHLVLVGQDIGTLSAIHELVSRMELDGRVRFVTNSLHPEPIIAGSEIGILASLYGEGISNSILEYMYLKKPVIATDSGGNRELVQDGETGILVKKQSPKELAEAIDDLLSRPDQARKMGEAGHQYVREHFALDRMVRDYEDLYSCLLSA